MYANRAGDPLTDADIDRELSAALDVDPSPEFLARVRMTIDSAPRPSPWRRWALVSAAACVATIVALTTLAERQPPALPQLMASLAAIVPSLTPSPLAIAVAASQRSKGYRTEKPTAQMRAVMSANAETAVALRAARQSRDYGALASSAATYKLNFGYLEKFWTANDARGAMAMSRAGLMAAAALETAALAGDEAAIDSAIAAILGSCGACHKHYREELPDGSYEIRL